MINNGYYSQDVHGPYELHNIGNIELEDGGTIRDCTLAYATFGTLDAAKDNAILIPTLYSGTNKIMEQVYIGEGPPARSRQVFRHYRQSDSAMVFRPRRTTRLSRLAWRISQMCASATTCALSTN
jgi:hypothetical protein